jgi:PhoPQ-activated pathogenicity-related protein
MRATLTALAILLLDASMPSVAHGEALPPASVFDLDDLMRPAGETVIVSDEVLDSKRVPGRKVRRIRIEFPSHVWGGEPIRIAATVYSPAEGVAPAKRGAAIINQGKSGNVDAGFDLEGEYGEHAALRLGIPSMLLQSSMPGDHFGRTGEGPMRRYTSMQYFETGDPDWIHWISMAKSYMRAMTVLGTLEGIEAERFVLGGSSKRGQTLWIVAATDPRVAGIVPMARPGHFTHLMRERYHGAIPAAAVQPDREREYMTTIDDMYSRRGYEYLAHVDPYFFMSRLSVPVMGVMGTNDGIFEPFDDLGSFPFYRGDKSFVYVPNYGHGMGTQRHVDAYLFWAAHCLWGQPVPRLSALAERRDGALRVLAIVRSDAALRSVQAWYCPLRGPAFDDDADRYRSHALTRVGSSDLWEGTAPLGADAGREIHWYVEAVAEGPEVDGVASTLLDRVPAQ